MTREQIEKAAKDYVMPNARISPLMESIAAKEGFIAGAQWRINSVWHCASEKPDKNQLVVFECRKTYGRGYSVNFGENYDLLKNVVLKWAYVIDLLPERKEKTK
ncbi:hypothetical protein [Bacteroides sp. An322]|uniref:hypothetical protein n=1 Tax=Bacteroides sp. An322 TaxID=1965632 RepID=UPI000B37D65C|nr:hypothetical protein [Bacteroides sp. An322]OUO23750.1 hypothetical protein B5F91_02595 [Bacteroides sp. An322]